MSIIIKSFYFSIQLKIDVLVHIRTTSYTLVALYSLALSIFLNIPEEVLAYENLFSTLNYFAKVILRKTKYSTNY